MAEFAMKQVFFQILLIFELCVNRIPLSQRMDVRAMYASKANQIEVTMNNQFRILLRRTCCPFGNNFLWTKLIGSECVRKLVSVCVDYTLAENTLIRNHTNVECVTLWKNPTWKTHTFLHRLGCILRFRPQSHAVLPCNVTDNDSFFWLYFSFLMSA